MRAKFWKVITFVVRGCP